MTFPTIPTTGAGRVLTTNQLDSVGTRTFPAISGLTRNNGDLLIAIIYCYQSTAAAGAIFSGWTAGWTELADLGGSTNGCLGVAYRWADGTEATPSVTQAATITGDASMILMSVANAHPSTPPEISALASGTAAAADPASLDPAGWAAEDTLWIAAGGNGMTSITGAWTGTTAAPTNYGSFVSTAAADTSTIGDCDLAVAFRQLNASAEDAGGFTTDLSNARNHAALIAVRPAADPQVLVHATVVINAGPITAPMVGYTGFNLPSTAVPGTPPRPIVVAQQALPVQLPEVTIGRPPTPPAAAAPGVPVNTTVVPSQQAIPLLPFTLVNTPHAPIDAFQRPLVVSAQELPQQLPFVSVATTKTASISASQVPVHPTVVTAEPPITASFIGHVGFNADSSLLPTTGTPRKTLVVSAQELPPPVDQIILWTVVSDWNPPEPTIVKAAELPPQSPFVLIGATKARPATPAPQVPVHPTVVTAEPPITAPFIGRVGFNADSGILPTTDTPRETLVVPQQPLAPQPAFVFIGYLRVAPAVFPAVPIRSTVVSAQPYPQPVQSPIVWQPRVDLAAQPPVPIRPTFVGAQPLPQPVQSPHINWTPFDEKIVGRPTIVTAQPLPQPVQSPIVWQPKVDLAAEPPVSVKPTIVQQQPLPLPTQAPQVVQQRVDLAAQPSVSIKPTVVNAQPLPPQYGQSSVSHGFAAALAAAEPPPKPVVIGVQPYPPQTQSPWVNRTLFDEKIVGRLQIIGQQPTPPQAAFIFTPTGGRWGDPPPRIIRPQVNVDMSLPFRPNGSSRVAHGFGEALPLLFEGTVTGGVLSGASITGAGSVGGSLTGFSRDGYVTGGVR